MLQNRQLFTSLTLKQNMETGRACSRNGELSMDQTLHRVTTAEKEEVKGTTK